MPVIDASVVAEYLSGAEHGTKAREMIFGEAGRLWAPHLLDAEVGRVLRRATVSGAIDVVRAQEALGDLAGLAIKRVAHHGLLLRALELRSNLSFYDALYVALAERLKMALITFDGRLARAARSATDLQVIDVLGDSSVPFRPARVRSRRLRPPRSPPGP